MDHPILYRKGIIVIDTGLMSSDLDGPVSQVFAIEKLNPIILVVICKKGQPRKSEGS
jgi:hypothetical protein